MSEYKRLTDKQLAEKYRNHYYGDSTKLWDAYVRLAELEDKIENGTLVELPCKIGDTIFVPYIYKGVSDIMRLSIVEIKISQYSIAFITDFETDDDVFAIKFSNGRFLYGTYNDIWFTDEIKAKAELQRLKGEN